MNEQVTPSLSPDRQRTDFVFGILLSGSMATVFAGFFPLLALGFTSEWLMTWGMGILTGWPLGFALVALIRKPLMTMAVWLTHQDHTEA